jgi:NADPH:quinone reductase
VRHVQSVAFTAAQPCLLENDPKRARETLTELLGLLGSGRLRPVVYDGKYTLETLSQGLQDLENRKTWGKAVVRVREPVVRGKL